MLVRLSSREVESPVQEKYNLDPKAHNINSGFAPFFEQKIQELFKDFQGHISHFSRTPFSAKKSPESMSFLVLPQHE